MEEEVIVIVKKPPQNPNFAAEADSMQAQSEHFIGSRAEAIAWLAGTQATDDRS